MLNRTIAKFGGVVILFACSSVLLFSCSHSGADGKYKVNSAELSPDYDKPVVLGTIDSSEIIESSGLAASPCQPDVLWTHNDSGDDAFIYAIDRRGKHLGTWRVANARNNDWEDMASYRDGAGTCYLYIGDIGNNEGKRPEPRVYRVKEPVITPDAVSSGKKNPLMTDAADVLPFKYPDAPHDAETLLVHPKTGEVYVLTKRTDAPSFVFKLPPNFGSTERLIAKRVGEVSLPTVLNGLLTGGAVALDGHRVILSDYVAGYELTLPESANFDDIWRQRPVPVDLGARKQGEAVTFGADGTTIYATSERKNSPVIEVRRR